MSELTERLGQIKEQEERSRTRMLQDLILKLQIDKLKTQLSESKIRQQIQEGSFSNLQLPPPTVEREQSLKATSLGGPAEPTTITKRIPLEEHHEEIQRAIGGLFPWVAPPSATGVSERVTVPGPEGQPVSIPGSTWYQKPPQPDEPEPKTWIDSSGRLVQKTDVEYERAMGAGEVLTDNVKGYTQTIKDYYAALAQADEKTKREIAENLGYKDSRDLRAILGTASFLRQMAIEQAMQDYGQGLEDDYGKYDLSR